MTRVFVCSEAAIVLLCILLCNSPQTSKAGTCSRRPPSGSDCSAHNGDCHALYEKNNANSIISSTLPFPPANTRTCYRTCYEGSVCKSFLSVVNQQPLSTVLDNDQFKTQRIFSPRYGTRDYRKSTNCRHTVKCKPGQIISYSVHGFDLEQKATCSGSQECIDWVEIEYRNLGTSQRFCGSGEVGQVHVENANEMQIEFVSNRRTDHSGFQYFVTCITPGFDKNAVNLGVARPSASIPSSFFRPNQCSQPPNLLPRPTAIMPDGVNLILGINPGASPRTFTVRMSGSIIYQNDIIQVKEGLRVLNTIRGIRRLEVGNRFSSVNKRYYPSLKATSFNGYGTLVLSDGKAYFYQLGADPIFQPTPDEAETILELENQINKILGDDVLDIDIGDKFDLELYQLPTVRPTIFQLPTERPTIFFPSDLIKFTRPLPTISPPFRRPFEERFSRQIRSRSISRSTVHSRVEQLAVDYGNACNAVLQATACAFQAVTMGRDCASGQYLF